MKSSFLLLLVLSTLASAAWGQAKSSTAADPNKSAFDKFYERLSIGYFGAYSSPTLKDWDSRYAAISHEIKPSERDKAFKHRDSYSQNIWSQVNFAYNYGGKFKFNVIPRFTTFLSKVGNSEGGNQDNGRGNRGVIQAEDMLIGFSGVVLTSDDKKFAWWMRPGLRLPTSRGSKNGVHSQFGQVSHQPEFLTVISYDFDPTFQAAMTYMGRFWIYEDRYNYSRMRNYINPYITYTINDKTKFQAHYEFMYQNNRNWKSIDNQDPFFQDLWQNAYVGVAYDVTDKLNVQPLLNMFVDDSPISMDSFWLAVWISYSIK